MVEEPVKALAKAAIEGAEKVVKKAKKELKAFSTENKNTTFPESLFSLSRGLKGESVRKLSDLERVMKEAERLLPRNKVSNSLWLPYLGDALNAGMSTLLAEEVIETIKIWQGLSQDLKENLIKKIHTLLVKGSIVGLAGVIGAELSREKVEELLTLIGEKKLFAFFIGLSRESPLNQTLQELGTSQKDYLLSLSDEISGMARFLGLLVQMAIRWGNIKPGETRKLLSYIKDEIFAFLIVLGDLTPIKAANIAGAISFGVHSVGQVYIPQLLPIHSLP